MSDIDPGTSPTRICRKCSVASTTPGDFCPSCGTSYQRRSRRPSRKVLVIGLVALMIVGGATAGLLVKRHNDEVGRERAAAKAERAAEREAEAATTAQEEANDAERSLRRDLVKALEKQITKDAKEKVDEDLLDGPIKYSSCTATGGGSTDDLTALTGTFECIAVNIDACDVRVPEAPPSPVLLVTKCGTPDLRELHAAEAGAHPGRGCPGREPAGAVELGPRTPTASEGAPSRPDDPPDEGRLEHG